MRLPSTVNWPTAMKREAGRKPAIAEWVFETKNYNAVVDLELCAAPCGGQSSQRQLHGAALPSRALRRRL
jgi:hypothetical protein